MTVLIRDKANALDAAPMGLHSSSIFILKGSISDEARRLCVLDFVHLAIH